MTKNYQPPDGYVTIGEAQRRLKVSKVTIAKIVKEAGIPTFRDPRNGRVRLLLTGDVDRLEQPVPEADKGNAQAA
jgi:hypothetical protein